jgi:hypothetical protein
MGELAPPAKLGSSPDPVMVMFLAHPSPRSIQPSSIPADEPVERCFRVLRNPNEVNNVNLNNRQRMRSISRAGSFLKLLMLCVV